MAEQQFDVFMCHNSRDKHAVIEISSRLQERGIKPWLDEWELRPGLSWQVALEEQIEQIKTAAVFVGSAGLGPWQEQEMRSFLSEFLERGCPVIPVLLHDVSKEPELPYFLKGKTWVDFRRQRPEPFSRLVWGITGTKPGSSTIKVEVGTTEPLVTTRIIEGADNFEDSYLARQASDCQALHSDGLPPPDGTFVPLLRDVFVPLELDLSASSPGYRATETLERRSADDKTHSFSIWEFLAKARTEKTFRQLAILAWGGYGKTTLMKHVAYRMGTKQPVHNVPQMIPFLLVLRKYREMLTQKDAPTLPRLIMEHHVPKLAGANESQQGSISWVEGVLREGRALVMFDGFDEVTKTQRTHHRKVAK